MIKSKLNHRLMGAAVPLITMIIGLLITSETTVEPISTYGLALLVVALVAAAITVSVNVEITRQIGRADAGQTGSAKKKLITIKHLLEGCAASTTVCSTLLVFLMYRA